MDENITTNKRYAESKEISKFVYENIEGRHCRQFKVFSHLNHHINIPIFDLINGNIYLEIGCHYGHSLCSMAYAFEHKKLYSIDLFDNDWFKKHGSIIPDVYKLVEKNIKKFNKNNTVQLIRGNSQSNNVLQKIENILGDDKIDLLYIDGDHSYHAVKSDFENYFKFVKNGGFIVFDDYLPINTECHNAINDVLSTYSDQINIIGTIQDYLEVNKIKPSAYLLKGVHKPVYNMSYIVQKK